MNPITLNSDQFTNYGTRNIKYRHFWLRRCKQHTFRKREALIDWSEGRRRNKLMDWYNRQTCHDKHFQDVIIHNRRLKFIFFVFMPRCIVRALSINVNLKCRNINRGNDGGIEYVTFAILCIIKCYFQHFV